MATGSVFPRTMRNGSIVWRVRIWVGGKRRSFGSFPSKAAALAVLEERLQRYADTPGSRTVGSWGEEWLDLRETDGKHLSAANDRSRWNRHVVGTKLAATLLRQVTRADVLTWLDGMQRKLTVPPPGSKKKPKRLARQTIVHVLHLVQKCLGEAVDREHLAHHPALEIDMGEVEDVEWDYLRPDEIARVLALPDAPVDRERRYDHERWITPMQRAAITVSIYVGLRPGELFGLRRKDVDLEARRVYLKHSRSGPTKTKRHRVVPLLEPAELALRVWFKERSCIGDALVFPGPTDGPFSKGYDLGWPAVLRMARVTRPVLFRQLRHTCASHLVMGTWTRRPLTLFEVASWLGHRDPRTTMRYAHLCPDALSVAVLGGPQVAPGGSGRSRK